MLIENIGGATLVDVGLVSGGEWVGFELLLGGRLQTKKERPPLAEKPHDDR